MAVMRGLSDANLLKLCREAVHVNFHDCCFFCGQHKSQVPLEHHHLVKRRSLLLRYDWRNGILVCKYVCHAYAETPAGKAKIAEYLKNRDLLDYLQERSGVAKDWFIKHGITKRDYLMQMYEDLKEKIIEVPF